MPANPVKFPPGRARLLTRPVPIGSPTAAMTTGIVVVVRLAARAAGVPAVTMMSDLRAIELRAERREALVRSLGPAVLDGEIPALDVAALAKPLAERPDEVEPPEPRWSCRETRSGRPSRPAAPRRRAARRGGRWRSRPGRFVAPSPTSPPQEVGSRGEHNHFSRCFRASATTAPPPSPGGERPWWCDARVSYCAPPLLATLGRVDVMFVAIVTAPCVQSETHGQRPHSGDAPPRAGRVARRRGRTPSGRRSRCAFAGLILRRMPRGVNSECRRYSRSTPSLPVTVRCCRARRSPSMVRVLST